MEKQITCGFNALKFTHKTPGNLQKGLNLFSAGHVLDISERNNQIVSKVIRQTSVTFPPYEVVLEIDNTRNVISSRCACIAGISGHCKHISAVVVAVNSERCETKTSTVCSWGKPSSKKVGQIKYSKGKKFEDMFYKKNYEKYNKAGDKVFSTSIKTPIPFKCPLAMNYLMEKEIEARCIIKIFVMGYRPIAILLFNIFPSVIFVFALAFVLFFSQSEDLVMEERSTEKKSAESKIFEQLIARQDSSLILNRLADNALDLKTCCFDTYNQKIVSDPLSICKETFLNNAKWLDARKYRVTASRAYHLFTYKKNMWKEKATEYFSKKPFWSKYTAHGIKFEKVAREIYARDKNVEIVETGLIVSKRNPWLGVSPDGIIMNGGVAHKLLEIKCPYKGQEVGANQILECCNYIKLDKDGNLYLKKRHVYYGQVQTTMTVLNLEVCDFMLYFSSDSTYKIVTVPFDKTFCQNMLTKIKNNYFYHMLHELCEQ